MCAETNSPCVDGGDKLPPMATVEIVYVYYELLLLLVTAVAFVHKGLFCSVQIDLSN